MPSRLIAGACGVLLLPHVAFSMSLVLPTDFGDLAAEADAVLRVVAQASTVRARGSFIFTDTMFSVVEALSGDFREGDLVEVRCPGGVLDRGDGSEPEWWFVPGSPEFEPKAAYIVCLSRVDRGGGHIEWIPSMLSYGLFAEVTTDDGDELAVPLLPPSRVSGLVEGSFPRPDGLEVEPCETYALDAFLAHVRGCLSGEIKWNSAKVRVLEYGFDRSEGGGAGVPTECSYFESDGRRFRWSTFDRGGRATIYANAEGDPSIRDGGFWVIQEAMDLWMNIPDAGFNLQFGGARAIVPNCSGGQDSVNNFVLFDDPCSDISNLNRCSGVLAYGGPRGSGSHSFEGDGGATWWTVSGWIVVVNNGAGCLGAANYRVMMAHELGHGLGFGHVDDSGALMFANCCRNINSTDRLCGSFTYPARNPDNARPQASAGSNRSVALVGNTLQLVGSASDDLEPDDGLDYEWVQLAGPGFVTFSDPAAGETQASFSASGKYLLGLRVYDGDLLDVDQVEVDVEVFVGTRARLTFQQGVDGYTGCVDTCILESEPEAMSGSASEIEIDGDDPSDTGFDSQGLMRFEGIFGSSLGQIPPGVTIERAWLELETTNSGDGAKFHRMLVPWEDSDTWETRGGSGLKVGGQIVATPDAMTGGVGDPVVVDVTRSLEAWSRDPGSNLGWAIVPIGADGWDFFSSEGQTPPRLVVEYPVFERSRLIELGETWDYFRGTTSPAPGWNDVEFEGGAGWRSGATGIGYGDGDDVTLLSDMEDRYTTIYCRREFDLPTAGLVGRLELAIDYDDGFVAYVNGVEVARSSNMGPVGSPVDRNTAATPGHEAGSFEVYALDAAALRSGMNVLAVEVHNAGISSSDLSFRPELSADLLLVPGGSTWRYLPGTSSPPAEWKEVAFDDGGWPSGPTGIGYGDGDDLTVLEDMQGSYVSLFCRTSFEIECPGAFEAIRATIVVDDGFVAYLNGEEIARENMPAGIPSHETEASGSREPSAVSIEVPVELLREGRNVLAVSVHNADIDSSDLSFMAVVVPFVQESSVGDCEGAPISRFRRGDVGNDGIVDVSDAVTLLLSLFAGGAQPSCLDSADIDDDGAMTLSDGVSLLNYLFEGASPPAFPGVSCGQDPTADELEGCSTVGCVD